MEIQYHNNSEDFRLYYTRVWSSSKSRKRSEYYWTPFWYLSVLGLAIYVAAKHDEGFAIAVFGLLAFYYIKQNWSFERHWANQINSYADAVEEGSSRLVLNDEVVVEQFSGIEIRVPWSEIHNYDVQDERLFIEYLKNRAMIVPFRHLSAVQKDELMSMLEKHHVKTPSVSTRTA